MTDNLKFRIAGLQGTLWLITCLFSTFSLADTPPVSSASELDYPPLL